MTATAAGVSQSDAEAGRRSRTGFAAHLPHDRLLDFRLDGGALVPGVSVGALPAIWLPFCRR
ncbi:hypothetical protein ADU59_06205 [Pararhizobium polonicum]|uniref:Uncharacterized protein n=1 Tax=Pararhizobium polonicum TaxID=1612624 RepID=A0A1C7P426_9HYPH|nr:hypothetical protein [Pararhizobium polonicum]OBZ95981.1 hypothetical protein ADU59_06205 [Pararhizobium polonicum]